MLLNESSLYDVYNYNILHCDIKVFIINLYGRARQLFSDPVPARPAMSFPDDVLQPVS